jgi:hypothetical protein
MVVMIFPWVGGWGGAMNALFAGQAKRFLLMCWQSLTLSAWAWMRPVQRLL